MFCDWISSQDFQRPRQDFPNKSLEIICIEGETPHSNTFIVIAWYRLPSEPNSCFDSLQENLSFFDREGKEIIILGDTNRDFSHANNSPSHVVQLPELYDLFGMTQLIKEPTRVTLDSSTLIDHIATTNCNNIAESGVLEISLSDHYLVYCIRKLRGGVKCQHKCITSRQLKNFNQDAFLFDLSEVDWEAIVANAHDIDVAVRQWTHIFALIVEKHAPTLNRRVSDRFTPWLNADYFKLAKTRDKLKSQAVKGNSKLLMECYKHIRNRVNNMNTQLKRKYFSEKLTQFQGDLKKTWKTINQVINKKSSTTVVPCLTVRRPDSQRSQRNCIFNERVLCSIGNKLSEKLPRKANPLLSGEYAIETLPLSFSFSAIMTDKLSSTLNKMKTSHGSGHDGIASFYLKIALPVVGGSLCDLLNKSLLAGKFPEDWKIARIAPIFKSGAMDDRSNYRPISVLPFISRLFEKLIFNQFYEYMDANKSLYEHQSCFRLLHSVATALMAGTNDWYLNIDKGKYTGLIFIDLKKVFDTVDHEILLEKLKMY